MKLTYKDVCTIGTGLILIGTSFIMGVFFANQTYDYHILFNAGLQPSHFENSLRHYQTLYYTAPPVLYALGAVVGLGLVGCLIKVYKPNPDLKVFEYATLVMYVIGVCMFITNIKTGIESSVSGNWGEVTENQGVAVIASSNVILLVIFVGVLVLQAGLWYSHWEYQQRLEQFYAEEAKTAAAAPTTPASEAKPVKQTEAKKQK
ncbi:LAQU0S05e04192g1_1 [Lachancea quebecensis]|uniref:LAQU0S05e04192g1_1 n=1 Tax=Lachancea quebecensis TaxID=1654605 RepID=A0A0P1KRS4_9SACH|nr:LAQU0S05e04192g1_1 [Lachancea quebecensis]